jgi:hypothetical protein
MGFSGLCGLYSSLSNFFPEDSRPSTPNYFAKPLFFCGRDIPIGGPKSITAEDTQPGLKLPLRGLH